MKDFNIFYSWQSDLDPKTNRNFIERCLKSIIKNYTQKSSKANLLIDQATRNESGSADIPKSIFSKIEKSDIFVADITIINKSSKFRPMPNPNVLIELGYAASHIGWDKIICINNSNYGRIEELPFDIRHRKIINYNHDPNEEINLVKKELTKKISFELFKIIDLIDPEDFNNIERNKLNYKIFTKLKEKLSFEQVVQISNFDFEKDTINSLRNSQRILRKLYDSVEDPDVLYLQGKLMSNYISLIECVSYLSSTKPFSELDTINEKTKKIERIVRITKKYTESASKIKSLYTDFLKSGQSIIET